MEKKLSKKTKLEGGRIVDERINWKRGKKVHEKKSRVRRKFLEKKLLRSPGTFMTEDEIEKKTPKTSNATT